MQALVVYIQSSISHEALNNDPKFLAGLPAR